MFSFLLDFKKNQPQQGLAATDMCVGIVWLKP